MTNKSAVGRDWAADRAICDAATAGPWRLYGGKFGETNIYADDVVIASDIDWDRTHDGRFIAEARTGWPAALDEIRHQVSEIQRYRQALESIAGLTMSMFANFEDMAKYAKRTAGEALEGE